MAPIRLRESGSSRGRTGKLLRCGSLLEALKEIVHNPAPDKKEKKNLGKIDTMQRERGTGRVKKRGRIKESPVG